MPIQRREEFVVNAWQMAARQDNVPTQTRQEFRYLLICSGNPREDRQQRLWTLRADHTSPVDWADDLLPLSADKYK